jgi:hypothetical protein
MSHPPGTVGRLVGPAAQVAYADEWVLMDKALVEGRYLPAADILQSGARLENGI